MTMNSSGQISLGGTVVGESIELENGGPGTAQISLDDPAVRTLAGVPGSGTTIIMPTNFYGKSNSVAINLVIASDTQGYDVWANVSGNPSYVAGKTNVTVTVNPGVNVGASSTGSYAMLVPSSFNPGDNVTIVNNGYIIGAGGSGGPGGSQTPVKAGTPGNPGGNALYVNRPTTITNNNLIGSGGGGGGGGGEQASGRLLYSGSGGGGGGGYTGGSGGSAGSAPSGGGSPGSPGSTSGGGSGGGGPSPGGPGGYFGSGGSAGSGSFRSPGSGGGTGNYIVGNAFVTWPATGTRLGNVA